MRAARIIQRQFESDLKGVHLARVRVLFAAAFTLLRSGKLSLTSLGRAIAVGTSPKHGIKRIDRLLGNTKLHAEQVIFYRAIARRLIAPASRPVLLVDWTAVTPQLWALVAAVCFEGRALIVYAEAHPISRYLKPHVNEAFLQNLAGRASGRLHPDHRRRRRLPNTLDAAREVLWLGLRGSCSCAGTCPARQNPRMAGHREHLAPRADDPVGTGFV